MAKQKNILAGCEAFKKLNPKQKLFCLEYLKDYSATQAAIRAGYSKKVANQNGPRLLVNAGVQAALKEASEKVNQGLIADAQELREFWTKLIRADIGRVCSWGDGGFSFNSSSHDMAVEDRRLIKKIRVTEKTSPKGDFNEVQTSVEIHDPLKASELLGKSLGIFIDKSEWTGKDGDPIQMGGKLIIEFIGAKDE